MENLNLGERLSFFQLFNNKQFQIEVPIIQRDYAQGRVEENEVRDDFVDALKNYLDENTPNRDLDFVYGSLSGNKFIPLDGQQRLTTLFLLHWYISLAENRFSDLQEWLLEEINDENSDEISVSKFSYKTRTSSEAFCNLLLNTKIDLSNLLPSDHNKEGKSLKNDLSKTIRDKGSYFLTWENDPTIKSMLIMLDAIHYKFKDAEVKNYYDRLVSNEKPIITFLLLNLDEFNLSDDLYIKMNSRGIPLTPFENLKAKLLQFIKLKMKFQETYILNIGNIDQKVPLSEYFSFKIDRNWTNLLWAYSKEEKEKTIDKKMMNFIRFCFSSSSSLSKNKSENIEYLLGTNVARNLANYSEEISFNKYISLEGITEDSIRLLLNSLDCLENADKKIKQLISDDFLFYFDDAVIFEKVLSDDLTFATRIQFYAYIRFLIHNEGDNSKIDDWLRVVHNLIERPLDKASDFVSALKEIDKLISNCGNILEHLREDPQIDFFYKAQVKEEKLKAFLLKKKNWINPILKMEKHPYFKGQILFIFEFSGVLEYFENNGNCNWSNEENSEYLKLFNQYCNKVKCVFNDDPNEMSDFVWARAVLSKGNYLISKSADRFNFLTSLRKNKFRDYSWKRMLRLQYSSDGKVNWKKKRNYVKAVLDDPDFDVKDISNSLNTISKKYNNGGWRQYFIDHPELIDYCEQGFISKVNDDILLYKESQANHTHIELYTKILHLTKIHDDTFPPFHRSALFVSKSNLEKAGLRIDRWSFKDRKSNYAIDIRRFPSQEFQIRFFDKNLPQEYNQDILQVLRKFNFVEDHTFHDDSYTLACNENNLIPLLTDVSNSFNSI